MTVWVVVASKYGATREIAGAGGDFRDWGAIRGWARSIAAEL
jgi:hypothetical protein